MVQIKIEDYEFVPLEKITTPIDGTVEVMVNGWWPVDEQGRVALYNPLSLRGERTRRYGAAQANRDERTVRYLHEKGYSPWAVDIIQIPVAYLRMDY